ncbi:hypothetical protein L5515_000513 [Caenorhabditis briggsae]|uniref:Uncharacterized protein n=1 Tax=Caenorhabditis briggsae TaxID=6238 RepID=A0AAE9J2C7_CAEBR|nr:hypothetical protein L5515_000513 [Caenorhabditis briggsae]
MKLSFLVTIVYCLHVVYCAPTSSITKANSENSGEINLLTSMKKLLEQGNVSVKNQKSTTSQGPTSDVNGVLLKVIEQAISAQNDAGKLKIENEGLKKDLEKCQQCSASLEKIEKNVEELLKSIGTPKHAPVPNPSGYALPKPHDQYVLPDGNKQFIIEVVEDGNRGAYVQRP